MKDARFETAGLRTSSCSVTSTVSRTHDYRSQPSLFRSCVLNSGDQDIVSNLDGPGFGLRKTADQRLLTAVSTDRGIIQTTHDDLQLQARSWKDADDPLRMSFVQIKFVGGERVHAWLNGAKSSQSPEMPSGIPDGTPLDMRIGYSPNGLSGGRFAGYVVSLKIYTDNLPEAWLQLSRQAEYDDSLLERSEEEVLGNSGDS